jgi:hypothetical protein
MDEQTREGSALLNEAYRASRASEPLRCAAHLHQPPERGPGEADPGAADAQPGPGAHLPRAAHRRRKTRTELLSIGTLRERLRPDAGRSHAAARRDPGRAGPDHAVPCDCATPAPAPAPARRRRPSPTSPPRSPPRSRRRSDGGAHRARAAACVAGALPVPSSSGMPVPMPSLPVPCRRCRPGAALPPAAPVARPAGAGGRRGRPAGHLRHLRQGTSSGSAPAPVAPVPSPLPQSRRSRLARSPRGRRAPCSSAGRRGAGRAAVLPRRSAAAARAQPAAADAARGGELVVRPPGGERVLARARRVERCAPLAALHAGRSATTGGSGRAVAWSADGPGSPAGDPARPWAAAAPDRSGPGDRPAGVRGGSRRGGRRRGAAHRIMGGRSLPVRRAGRLTARPPASRDARHRRTARARFRPGSGFRPRAVARPAAARPAHAVRFVR